MKRDENCDFLGGNIADMLVLHKAAIAPFKDTGTSVLSSTPASHFSVLAKIGSITC